MKSKATLSQIELIIMILVFAVAAASGLRVFTYADSRSSEMELNDFAVTEVRNAAEAVKHTSGDMKAAAELMGGSCSSEGFEVFYGSELEKTVKGSEYILAVKSKASDTEGLGCAEISFQGPEGDIFALEVCWQEEIR